MPGIEAEKTPGGGWWPGTYWNGRYLDVSIRYTGLFPIIFFGFSEFSQAGPAFKNPAAPAPKISGSGHE
jgi:hypothetical protein